MSGDDRNVGRDHKESFASLFKTVTSLTEKTHEDAARHNVDLEDVRKKVNAAKERVREVEARRSALASRKIEVDQILKKEMGLTRKAIADTSDMTEVVKVKAEIVAKLSGRFKATTDIVEKQESAGSKKQDSLRAAVTQLKAKIKVAESAEASNHKLEAEIEAKKRTWEEVTSPKHQKVLDDMRDRAEDLGRQTLDVNCLIRALDVEGLRKQLESTQSELEAKEAAVAEAERANEDRKKRADQLSKKCSETKAKLQEVSKARDAEKTRLEEMQRIRQDYAATLKELQEKKDKLAEAIEVQKGQEKELQALKEKLHALNTVQFDQECKIKQLEETTTETAKIKAGNKAKSDELAKANAALDARETGLDAKVAEYHDQIAQLKLANSQLSVIMTGLKDKLKDQKSSVSEKFANNEALTAELNSLKETMMETDKMIAVNRAAIDQQTVQLSEGRAVAQEIEHLETKVRNENDSYNTFEQSMGIMSQEMKQQCSGLLANLQREVSELDTKEASLETKLKNLEEELELVPVTMNKKLNDLKNSEDGMIKQAVQEAVENMRK